MRNNMRRGRDLRPQGLTIDDIKKAISLLFWTKNSTEFLIRTFASLGNEPALEAGANTN